MAGIEDASPGPAVAARSDGHAAGSPLNGFSADDQARAGLLEEAA